MSEYNDFIEEKNKIDRFFDEGYKIHKIEENLSGMFIEFYLNEESVKNETVQLQLVTPEGRKYVLTRVMLRK